MPPAALPAPLAILFDLDDTLVASTSVYAAALQAAGVDPGGRSYLQARTATKRQLQTSTSASHRLLYFKRMQQGLRPRSSTGSAHGLSPRQLLQQVRTYEHHLAQGVAKSFGDLKRRALLESLAAKVPLAVVTNETTRTQLIKWAAFDADGVLFRAFVTSEEVGHAKPAETIFRAATEQLGVKPESCWFVGDDIEADIVPALKLGMQALWATQLLDPSVARQQRTALPKQAHELAHLDELLVHLASAG